MLDTSHFSAACESETQDRVGAWIDRRLDGVTGRLPELARRVAVPQSDGVINRSQGFPAPSIIEGTTMEYYAGIDVSLESSSICVVDVTGRIVREAKVASEPEALI